MERRFSLAEGRGRLEVREEGPRAVLEAALSDDGRGLYKAYLTGGGARLLLGTLVPERGMLRLRRTFSVDELKRRGVWPPDGAQAELAFSVDKGGSAPGPPGWTRESDPAGLLGDGLLRDGARGLRGALSRRRGEGFELAVPWSPGQPFALAPAFCLARVERLGGEAYAVFAFDARGWPCVGHKAGEKGPD